MASIKVKQMNMIKNKKGFTLIELMIVIAIIGILASIAYPAYTDSVTKTRRAMAQANLTELASYMERHFTENNTYTGATIAASGIANDYYTFTSPIPNLSATAYTLTAEPTGSQASNDSCGDLTLSQSGVKGADTTDCW